MRFVTFFTAIVCALAAAPAQKSYADALRGGDRSQEESDVDGGGEVDNSSEMFAEVLTEAKLPESGEGDVEVEEANQNSLRNSKRFKKFA